MRSTISPYFSGYQGYRRNAGPEGITAPIGFNDRPVEVVLLNDQWQFVRHMKGSSDDGHGDGGSFEISFPDGDLAYLKSVRILKERGAYLFCREAGFELIPETDITHIPDCEKLPDSGHFSIQDGVAGCDLSEVSPKELETILRDTERLEELYIYTLLLADPERLVYNLRFNRKTGRLNSIDHNWSGMGRQMPLAWPEPLKSFCESGRRISRKNIRKLEALLAKESTVRNRLAPYYNRQVINDIFDCARFLIENPEITSLNDKNRAFLQSRQVSGSLGKIYA